MLLKEIDEAMDVLDPTNEDLYGKPAGKAGGKGGDSSNHNNPNAEGNNNQDGTNWRERG